MTPSTALLTPRRAAAALFDAADYARQRAFFAGRPELAPTPLRRLPGLAAALGLGEVWAKDESARFGLPAFKAVGADFAVASLLADGRLAAGATLACASAGNHGRAVARAARLAGCRARVYMARGTAPARVAAIAAEGAQIDDEAASYDEAVRRMAAAAEAQGWTILSDTAWPGYEDIPRRIMLGYTRLVDEIAAAWPHAAPPDLMLVPAGVGGLLGAVAEAARTAWTGTAPTLAAVEPLAAACLQASARAGRPLAVAGPLDTEMAGLRCGEASTLGFAAAFGRVDAWLAIDDGWSHRAMRRLAQPEDGDPLIQTNASGAATLGGLLALLHDPALAAARAAVPLTAATRVLVFVTEGVTDPDAFARLAAPA